MRIRTGHAVVKRGELVKVRCNITIRPSTDDAVSIEFVLDLGDVPLPQVGTPVELPGDYSTEVRSITYVIDEDVEIFVYLEPVGYSTEMMRHEVRELLRRSPLISEIE